MHVYMYIYLYVFTRARAHTHTHTNTHTQAGPSDRQHRDKRGTCSVCIERGSPFPARFMFSEVLAVFRRGLGLMTCATCEGISYYVCMYIILCMYMYTYIPDIPPGAWAFDLRY